MKFKKVVAENSLEQCASLSMHFGQEPPDSLQMTLIPEVRFGEQHVAHEKCTFTVALTEAAVVVEPTNCKFVRESRLGDSLVEGEEHIATVQKSAQGSERKNGGSFDLGGSEPTVSLSVTGHGVASSSKSTEKTFTEPLRSVQCVAPGNRWRIRDGKGDTLSGKYVGDDTLCVLETEVHDQGAIETSMQTSKRDLAVNVLSWGILPPTKKKMIEIVVAKALGANPGDGHIVLAKDRTEWSFD